jgi:diacylglycerol O-acyltransferase / wax synthase
VPPERLSPEDARILKLESGTIAGHTCKVAIVVPQPGSQRPTVELLRERIARRLGSEPRLRCKLASTPLGLAPPLWVEDPSFDIGNHVRRLRADSPVSSASFRKLVAEVMTQRLDRTRPLWQLDVVDELDDGTIGLIWRLHHCMVDGVGALKLGSALLWDSEPEPAALPSEPVRRQDEYRSVELLALGVGYRARGLGAVTKAVTNALGSKRKAPVRRNRPGFRAIVRRELGPSASLSPLDHSAGRTRAVAFASGALDDFKRVGHTLGTGITVNDVVLSVVAGAVRTWLQGRHASATGLRGKVPVSLHQHDEQPDALGNYDSYFFVDLPVDEPDPVRRLQAISKETSARKRDHDAELLARLPMHRTVSRWSMSPRVFTLNVSNVPGPVGPLSLLGGPVRELYSLAEIAEHHALRISVISASGTMFFGLCANREVVGDIDVLATGIDHSLAELLERVG